ncbi:hypothetical protein [Cupriavidus alkaliphilus]|uniref:hypothetical protein n=1 Tax=Cupriavidus alkaliphilus TaxID=942866 RepID=UPI00081563DA|nr:hypothetical protein [Cupriavidus alkaliphilus]SCB20873.1 hypothetical protein GA0116996_105150 [Cupriavidus alkaliphilus]
MSVSRVGTAEEEYLVFGKRFQIHAPQSLWASYFNYFSDSYEPAHQEQRALADTTVIRVRYVDRTDILSSITNSEKRVAFHLSSNYGHWNIVGYGDGHDMVLPEYGLAIQYFEDGHVDIFSDCPPHPRSMELVFHVARNISLYSLDRRNTLLCHASGVAFDNRIVLFGGNKGAGKSTLFIEAVSSGGAPFANDRTAIDISTGTATSWPSYLSYCEGTIGDYGHLTRAFLDYEQDSLSVGMKRWGTVLRRDYSQDAKRIIPPHFLTRALNRRYCQNGYIAAMVVPRLDPGLTTPFKCSGPLEMAALTPAEATALRMPQEDPDIPRWHGRGTTLSNTSGSDSGVALLRKLAVPAYRIEMNPKSGKEQFVSFLKTIMQ